MFCFFYIFYYYLSHFVFLFFRFLCFSLYGILTFFLSRFTIFLVLCLFALYFSISLYFSNSTFFIFSFRCFFSIFFHPIFSPFCPNYFWFLFTVAFSLSIFVQFSFCSFFSVCLIHSFPPVTYSTSNSTRNSTLKVSHFLHHIFLYSCSIIINFFSFFLTFHGAVFYFIIYSFQLRLQVINFYQRLIYFFFYQIA